MSAQTIEQISQGIHRLAQFVITGLVAAVLYFVKDMHSDFKSVQVQVNELKAIQQVQATQIHYLTQNIHNGTKN